VTSSEVDASRGDQEPLRNEPRDTSKRRHKKPLPVWQEVILLLVTAFVLALVVKTFFVQAFYIPSGSMEPTLQIDDKILVQKVSYWTGDIERGDIAVFDDPGGWLRQAQASAPRNAVQQGLEMVGLYPSGGHLVKRVIGIGGDTVRCCNRDGKIVVNGVALEEDYLPENTTNQGAYTVTVPEGRLWVLGDNRANSEDSHAHTGDPGGGFVDEEDVVGKVWAVVWPRGRMQTIDRPEVYEDQALEQARDAASGE
jgi:signal peptidase I